MFSRLLPEFPEMSVPFVHYYQCQAISEKTAMPKTANSSDESLLFETVRDMTAVLFSRLLLTDFLQHNCSTQGKKDFSFGRRYLCFTFAFMIRAWRGKTLASETSNQMIRLNPFRVFLVRKSAVPFVQKNPPRIPFKW